MTQAGQFMAPACGAAILRTALARCQKPEGPAKRAGKSIDETSPKVGQEIQKAGRQIEDAAGEAKK